MVLYQITSIYAKYTLYLFVFYGHFVHKYNVSINSVILFDQRLILPVALEIIQNKPCVNHNIIGVQFAVKKGHRRKKNPKRSLRPVL